MAKVVCRVKREYRDCPFKFVTSFSENDFLWTYLNQASVIYLFLVILSIILYISSIIVPGHCSFKRLTKCCLNIFPFKIHFRQCNKCMIKVAVSILSSYVMKGNVMP